jgi:hypothetical protein
LDEAAAQREREKDVLEDLEITVGETEISLSESELAESQLASAWTDPEPSEHDRVTVAPPMPEQEYVAKMMEELPEAERVPLSRAITPVPPSRAVTPARGLSKPPFGADSASPSRKSRRASARPKKKEHEAGPSTKPRARTSRAPVAVVAPPPHQGEPLTLDLSESLLPIAVPSTVPIPQFGPVSVPKFDTTESAPPPAPARPRATFAISQQNSALDAIAATAGLQSSDRPRFSFAPPSSHALERDPPRLSFRPASGDPLELVEVRAQSVRPGPAPKATMVEVRDRFDVGDFSGALALVVKILEEEPEHVDALLYAEHCRDVLKQMYISNLGGLRKVPQIMVSPEQLRWLALDHRAGFLLSQLDGHSTFEELLDVCGMPPFEAIRLLVQLLQQNVIRVV